jgi:Family of unknown function (DUF6627)
MKTLSHILILAMLHLCWLTSYGYAEMVPTESAIEQPSTSNTDRQRLLDLLDREEVIDELEKYGISKIEATARINSLTDEEVIEIAGKLDELPEGGYFVYILLIPFLVFGAVVICLIREPFCLIFECETPMNECVRSLLPFEPYSGGKQCQNPDTNEWLLCEDQQMGVSEVCASRCYSDFINTCMQEADNLKEEEQCNKEKQTCSQQCDPQERGQAKGKQCDFPCYTKFSDCMGKVTGAALTESICVDEKDSCLHQCESPEEGAGSNQYTWCQDDTNRWTLCKEQQQ